MNSFALPLPDFPSFWAAGDRSVTRSALRTAVPVFETEAQSSSVSIDDVRRELRRALAVAASEASTADWDGYGAKAVSASAISHAAELLDSLPTTVPPPDISIHPDGEVGFFWTRGKRLSVAVSISPTGLVSFASLHGHRRLHGSEYLVNGLPSSLALVLRQLHSDEE